MYLDFYRFKKAPFHITPDPEFLFLSPSHKEALASIIYGIEQRKGFIAVTGEVGVGKTTILRSYLERIDPNQLKTVYIFNSNVSFKSLLKTVHQAFDLETQTGDVFEMVNQLHQVLIREYEGNRNVALIIDEAQNMSIETLENLRMLSNLETSKDKLIQILLVGQPEFERILNLNELRQLKQRIAIRCRIAPLTQEESFAYINHRLAKAMGRKDAVFTSSALKRIVRHAKGIPRIINVVCDNALITGFGYQARPISSKIIEEVISDLDGRRRTSLLRWVFTCLFVLLVIAFLFWDPFQAHLLERADPFTSHTTAVENRIVKSMPNLHLPKTPFINTVDAVRSESQEAKDIGTVVDVRTLEKTQDPEAMEEPEQTQPIPNETFSTGYSTAGVHTSAAPPDDPTFPEVGDKDTGESASDDAPPRSGHLIRVVRKGDSLSKLVQEIYGFVNGDVIRWVQRQNPHLKNIHRLEVGDEIYFPDAASASQQ